MNADALRIEKKAQEFVQNLDRDGKPIAVICHGPWLLISAGLVKGRHMTSYKTIPDDLKNAGANWTDEAVVRDRNWVSSRQPSDIPQFNQKMIELFSESRQKTAQGRLTSLTSWARSRRRSALCLSATHTLLRSTFPRRPAYHRRET